MNAQVDSGLGSTPTVEAEAKLKSAEIEYQGGMDLSERGLQSKAALAKLAAQKEQTVARVDAAAAMLAKTELTAPFRPAPRRPHPVLWRHEHRAGADVDPPRRAAHQ